jgi:subtilisin
VDRIDGEVVRAAGNGGAGVKVGVIDTGIDYTHSDLDGNYQGGYDFVNADTDPMDDNGHGTHVAGTIAAEQNGAGVVGVAPAASLYAVKVLDATGSGSYGDVIAGLQWCVDNHMQIASLSLGGSVGCSTLETACNNAYAAGVLLVASAGNSGTSAGTTDCVTYPAKYASVIAVGATTQTDMRPSWSSTGPAVELVAPGDGIYSTARGGGYATMSGTSMACPHVTGAAALVIASGLASSPQGVRDRLTSTADDLGTLGRDNLYGFGLVDANEAAGVVAVPAAHVASIAVTVVTSASLKGGSANIRIVDAAGQPVAGAVVTGHWSGLATGNTSGATVTAGTVTLVSSKAKASRGTFTFTVDSVTKNGWTYSASANATTSGSISL